MNRLLSAAIIGIAISGCAMTSPVMDADNGTYMISAAASAVRDGAAGANAVAYEDANRFCTQRGGHAIVMDAGDRDVYVSSFGGSFNQYGGGVGGGTFAAGRTKLRFRCA
jgi:hypothetical protein